MDGNFFFVVGIVLVCAAVALAFFGIRGSDSFPHSRAVMVGVIGLFAAVVATTMAFAIVKSNDEQRERSEKQAEEEQQAQAEAGQPATSGAPGISLAVDSPSDGSLVFQPNGLTAKPGNVTITYDNPLAGPTQHRRGDIQRQRPRRGAALHRR